MNNWKKTVSKLVNMQALIEQANKEFKKLSKTEQRITICQDALQQIQKGIFTPTQSIYVEEGVFSNLSQPQETQQCLLTNNTKCKACALGSLLLSGVRCKNSIAGDTLEEYNNHDIKYYFDDIFDKKNLSLVECAFEIDSHFADDYYEDDYDDATGDLIINDEVMQALRFGEKYKKSKDRLVAILKNMIKNKGVFKP